MEGVTLRQKTSSASSQKDKSTKRKSNLNRALNEEQVISAIAESPGEMAPPSPASLPPGDSWDSARIFGMLEIQLEKFMSGMYFLGGGGGGVLGGYFGGFPGFLRIIQDRSGFSKDFLGLAGLLNIHSGIRADLESNVLGFSKGFSSILQDFTGLPRIFFPNFLPHIEGF